MRQQHLQIILYIQFAKLRQARHDGLTRPPLRCCREGQARKRVVNDCIQNLARRQAVRDVFARRFRWDEERFGHPVDRPTFALDTPAFAACFCDESFLECVAFVLHGKDASGLRRESQEKENRTVHQDQT